MTWDGRGYYYRAKKVNGRVVRKYVGAGPLAKVMAEFDAMERKKARGLRSCCLAGGESPPRRPRHHRYGAD